MSGSLQQTSDDAAHNPRQRIVGKVFVAGLLLLGAGVLVWKVAGTSPRRDPETSPSTPTYSKGEVSTETSHPVQVRGDGFVGSRECRVCHASHYKSWHASYHRTMTQVASGDAVVADFDGPVLEHQGRKYRLSRDGDRFFVTTQERKRRVVMTTGSHHMQICWLSAGRGRLLEMLPFVYLIDAGRWVHRDAAFITPPNSPPEATVGRWNVTCIACHTTHGQPRMHEGGADSVVAEFGISCEACHGPGEQHVRRMRNPDDDRTDLAIVQPQRLSHQRQAQVCGQCHGVINDRPGAYQEYLVHGSQYRAGGDLERHRHYFANPRDRSRFWSDGMVRVTGAEYNGLLESPCYQRGRMTCLSCHQMHNSSDDPQALREWANDQLQPGMRSNQACLQCHEAFADKTALEAHTHHRFESSGSSCYECHMPHTTYGLLKAIRSHTISSPSVQSTKQTGRLNACNLCHLDQTLEWSAEHLHRWYDAPLPELTEEERSTAASLLHLLKGDAGQRALAAWNMGRAPAVAASGSDWMAPFLSQLLVDPYTAVRFVAGQSLRKLPGFADFSYDYVGPEPTRRKAVRRAMEVWRKRPKTQLPKKRPSLLIEGPGKVDKAAMRQFIKKRDDRPLRLME